MPSFTVFTGRLFNCWTVTGVPFNPTLYSVFPILAVPEGRMTFCALTAFTTSRGDRPSDFSRAESMSTMIWRTLPP